MITTKLVDYSHSHVKRLVGPICLRYAGENIDREGPAGDEGKSLT